MNDIVDNGQHWGPVGTIHTYRTVLCSVVQLFDRISTGDVLSINLI